MMRLTDLLALSHVPRWSIVPRLREQSVADHTFRVMAIYTELCNNLPHPVNLDTLLRAMEHDGAESVSGDIPGIFKRRIHGEVTRAERHFCSWLTEENATTLDLIGVGLVKLADLIETYTFIKQWGHGPHADRVADHVLRDLHEHALAFPKIRQHGPGVFYYVDALVKVIMEEAGRDFTTNPR